MLVWHISYKERSALYSIIIWSATVPIRNSTIHAACNTSKKHRSRIIM